VPVSFLGFGGTGTGEEVRRFDSKDLLLYRLAEPAVLNFREDAGPAALCRVAPEDCLFFCGLIPVALGESFFFPFLATRASRNRLRSFSTYLMPLPVNIGTSFLHDYGISMKTKW